MSEGHNHSHSHRVTGDLLNILVMAALGVFLGWAFWSGRARDFLAPQYVWFTGAAAVILMLMVAAAAKRWLAGGQDCEVCAGEHAHERDLPGWVARLVLIAPVIAMLIVSPKSMSKDGMRKRVVANRRPRPAVTTAVGAAEDPELDAALRWIAKAEPRQTTLTTPAAGTIDAASPADPPAHMPTGSALAPPPLDPADLTAQPTSAQGGPGGDPSTPDPPRAASDVLPPRPTLIDLEIAVQNGQRDAIRGAFVTVIGRAQLWSPDQTARFDLVRLVVTCCIADARGTSAEVVGVPGISVTDGDWLRVSGTLQFDSDVDPNMPVIKGASIQKIPEPQNPYL